MNILHRWSCQSGVWKRKLSHKLLPWALNNAELGQDILEVGPGPGLVTDILRHHFTHVTAIEIDPAMADSLKHRLEESNVTVVEGDATTMPFGDSSFSGAVAFTMFHHVPSTALQDRLLAEVYRVLKPGGVFVGTDITWSPISQLIHLFDTFVAVEPMTLGKRLEVVGFTDVSIERARGMFKFSARHP